jgi:bifunctional DNA-binding transcriptional regulator/antitoxin component of YhaV-PrlF toxin-antitoxin module
METVTFDPTGKIYVPKSVREKIDVDSEYIIVSLPDGDIILHRVKTGKDPIKDFQKSWRISKSISKVREEILKEALKLAGT